MSIRKYPDRAAGQTIAILLFLQHLGGVEIADAPPLSRTLNVKHVTIYTDGICRRNPGPGGWAAVLRFGGICKTISGGDPATTNNRMELRAAIEALRALKEPCHVTLHTDSAYLRNGILKWVDQWKKRKWLTRGALPVQNEDLWRELDVIRERHDITWSWVKGHSRNVNNDECERLASAEIANINRACSSKELEKHLKAFFYHRKCNRQTAQENDLGNDRPDTPTKEMPA